MFLFFFILITLQIVTALPSESFNKIRVKNTTLCLEAYKGQPGTLAPPPQFGGPTFTIRFKYVNCEIATSTYSVRTNGIFAKNLGYITADLYSMVGFQFHALTTSLKASGHATMNAKGEIKLGSSCVEGKTIKDTPTFHLMPDSLYPVRCTQFTK